MNPGRYYYDDLPWYWKHPGISDYLPANVRQQILRNQLRHRDRLLLSNLIQEKDMGRDSEQAES